VAATSATFFKLFARIAQIAEIGRRLEEYRKNPDLGLEEGGVYQPGATMSYWDAWTVMKPYRYAKRRPPIVSDI
jgi:hypothetical protein